MFGLAEAHASAWMLAFLNLEDRVFTERRLRLWGCCLLAAYLGAFILRFFAGKWIILRTGAPSLIDFVQIWVGGRLALAGNGAEAFNQSVFAASQASLIRGSPAPSVPFYRWVYPPTLMLIAAPLAMLPYVSAFVVWVFGSLCVYLAAVYIILPYTASLVFAVLPWPVPINVFLGQASFFTAGLLGFSLIFMQRRPYLSGLLLGILMYKPQFGVFFPLALVITGQWRVIAGGITSAACGILCSALLFGADTWVLFTKSLLAHDPATLLPAHNLEAMNQTTFGLMHWAGAGIQASWALHIVITVSVGATACVLWMRPRSYPLKAAAFSLAALIATPYMLIYDLTTLSVPAAFIIEDVLASGFLPGERSILLGCFLALFLFALIPVGPIIILALLGLVLRRAARTAH